MSFFVNFRLWYFKNIIKVEIVNGFFFILKKIINIRVLNVLFLFVERENSLLGYLIYFWVILFLKIYWVESVKLE